MAEHFLANLDDVATAAGISFAPGSNNPEATVQAAIDYVSANVGAISSVAADLAAHIANLANPHAVTATQVGLGTSATPQFAGLNIGDPADTTLSRVSAGDLQIEANIIYRAGGTDVPVADGGTGSSTASGARTNLGLGTMATQDAATVAITGGTITGITDLAVTDGGTGSSTAGGARTNLGLGTIATQDANNVSITGGAITGITDLTIADGGTGQSTAAAAFDALSPNTTRGDLTVRGATGNVRLPLGVSGRVLTSNGTDAVWSVAAGAGDVVGPAVAVDNVAARFDGTTGKLIQSSGVTIDDSNNVSLAGLTTTGAIELGHATDTTLARSSAGNVSIEGNLIYRAGGTDVAVADGGTGASTATLGYAALAAEAIAYTGVISPTQITSNQNDYNPTNLATASIIRLDVDAARSITGLAGGSSGRVLRLINTTTAADITLTHEDAGSTAANRWTCPNGANFVLTNRAGVNVVYDGTTSRWRVAAGVAASGGAAAATQAEQEAGSSTTVYTSPGRQQFHPSACKCFGFTTGGFTPALDTSSYNVTSITDTAVGRLTVTIATDFSSAAYTVVAIVDTTTDVTVSSISKAAGSVEIRSYRSAALIDPVTGWEWVMFGDQ